MHETPVGRLVKLLRTDRNMSTVDLATHVGIPAPDLEMIEAGVRTLSIATIRRFAKALHTRTSVLLPDAPSESQDEPVGRRLSAIEKALRTYGSLSLTDLDTEAPGLAELSERLDATRAAWFMSPDRYSRTLDALPDLIVGTEYAVRANGRSPEACRLASQLYRLVRPALKSAGRPDLGGLISGRAMHYAELSGDQVLIAAAGWEVRQATLAGDMPETALDLATGAAEGLKPLLADGAPEVVSVHGALLLLAATAALRTGDPWRARELLPGPAREAAAKVSDSGNLYGLAFGPTNVAIHTVALEAETGQIGDALRLADDIDVDAVPSLERRTAHLYQVARCHERLGNDPAVLVFLQMAHRQCPEDFVFRRSTATLVGALVRRARPSYAPAVREFAAMVGMFDSESAPST